jgi:hypothetical protein
LKKIDQARRVFAYQVEGLDALLLKLPVFSGLQILGLACQHLSFIIARCVTAFVALARTAQLADTYPLHRWRKDERCGLALDTQLLFNVA